jgi:hypothetical protein
VPPHHPDLGLPYIKLCERQRRLDLDGELRTPDVI